MIDEVYQVRGAGVELGLKKSFCVVITRDEIPPYTYIFSRLAERDLLPAE